MSWVLRASRNTNHGFMYHASRFTIYVSRNTTAASCMTPLLIFLGTYVVLAIGGLPGFRVDRTGAAIIGASLMIGFNVLSMEEAFRSINYETILLLFGMMIVVANLRLSGFFAAVSTQVVQLPTSPWSCSAPLFWVP